MLDGYIKSRPLTVDIGAFLITGFDSGRVIAAYTPELPFAGITGLTGGRAADGVIDLQLSQEAEVRYGADVAAGDPLVASYDTTGRAIKVPSSFSGKRLYCIGFAQVAGKADDIGRVFLAPHLLVG